jgi:hypothetical protein
MRFHNLWWQLTEAAAATLHPRERDALLGDLEESKADGPAALLDVLGLVGRRQLEHWHSWRPWIAGFGIAVPCAFAAMGASLALSRDTSTLATAPAASFTAAVGIVLRGATLLLWAWSSGRSLGLLSRKTIGVSAILTLLPAAFCISRYRDAVLPFTSLLLLFPAMLIGMRHSLRSHAPTQTAVLTLASLLSAGLAIAGGTSIWWSLPAWTTALSARRSPSSAAG